jgi:hypothetical protein
MGGVLRAAAVYNLSFGILLVLAPEAVFAALEMPPTPAPFVRSIGMMVGVYALGYWIAASDPLRHWPLVAVGFAGKAGGTLGMLQVTTTGALPASGWTITVGNDLIWLAPFAAILIVAWRREPGALGRALGLGSQPPTPMR